MYCLEFLEENLDWLIEQLAAHPSTRRVAQRLVLRRAEAYPCLGAADTYFLFDCPGQVELYTHHESLTHILERLVKAGHRVWCGCARGWCIRQLTPHAVASVDGGAPGGRTTLLR